METRPLKIERALKGEGSRIRTLLSMYELPLEGVEDAEMWVARSGGRLVGCVGIERYGKQALLRSLAVEDSFRHKGLGSGLVKRVLEIMTQERVEEVLLLTDTTQNFFPRFGFEPLDRSKLRGGVLKSKEFQGACPQSALLMRYKVRSAAASSP